MNYFFLFGLMLACLGLGAYVVIGEGIWILAFTVLVIFNFVGLLFHPIR